MLWSCVRDVYQPLALCQLLPHAVLSEYSRRKEEGREWWSMGRGEQGDSQRLLLRECKVEALFKSL